MPKIKNETGKCQEEMMESFKNWKRKENGKGGAMKRFLVFGLGFALIAALSGRAFAWEDGFTITLTPTGERGVLIDTSSVILSLGDIGMGGSTRTVEAINVTSSGTIANIEYNIKGSVTGGAALSTNVTPDNTELLLQVQFNSADPGDVGYNAADVVDAAAASAGDGSPGAFEGDEDVDALNLGVTSHLWCRLELPLAAQYSGEQTIAVTITAEAGE
ncbi:MAG: hypothetical protein ABIJ15_01145 [bacterium]